MACCQRYFYNQLVFDEDIETITSKAVNGKTIPGVKTGRDLKKVGLEYLSSIEAYITLPNAKKDNLLNYLKGATNKLIL